MSTIGDKDPTSPKHEPASPPDWRPASEEIDSALRGVQSRACPLRPELRLSNRHMPDLQPFVKASLTKLPADLEIDPYSREFIFGSDERWARLKNQPVLLGPQPAPELFRQPIEYLELQSGS